MNKQSEICMFNRTCTRKDSEGCNIYCYPFVLLHGQKGNGGFWGASGVPAKYKTNIKETLPIQEDNPKAYTTVMKYIANVGQVVESNGLGLFLFSIPTDSNSFGTGTGKTTTAITILNEYIIDATRRHLRGERELKNNPAIFIKASEFQNKYNAQFRGSAALQQEASNSFYKFKERMKSVTLLVIDDIAVRDTTEAFKNELFEVIDHRATEELTTIFTSNYPLKRVAEFLGDRIASRIDGMALQIGFTGQDHRKGGCF